MAINKIFYGTCLLLCHISTFSQIQLHPKLGVACPLSRIIEGDNVYLLSQYFKGYNYYGIDLSKEVEKAKLIFGISLTKTGIATRFYDSDFFGTKYSITNTLLNNQLNLNFSYSILNREFNFMKHKILENHENQDIKNYYSANPRYLVNFRLEPFFGIGISKTIGNKYNSSSLSYYIEKDSLDFTKLGVNSSEIDVGSSFHYNPKTSNFNTKIIPSINLGLKIQFFLEKRDKLSISILYNQGLRNNLQTEFGIRKQNKDGNYFQYVARYASRASFWSINLSYPITLKN